MTKHRPKNPQAQRFLILWDPPRDPLHDRVTQTKVWHPRRMRFEQAMKQMQRLQSSPNTKGTFTIGEVNA